MLRNNGSREAVNNLFQGGITMRVQHNINALNANRNLGINNSNLAKNSEKLSSGYRINRAGDDAAGLAISEKMRNQIRGLNQASTNAQTGISLIQTAEGAMNETHSILQRMSELAVQASNDTNDTSVDKDALNNEVKQLQDELKRIGSTTQFNKMNILDGSFSNKYLQIGANTGHTMTITISGLSNTLATALTASVSTHAKASQAISTIQDCINKLSTQRSKLGAIQNRLEHTVANLDVASENATSSESLIRDVNMASEMVEYSKHNILLQASQSMLAQANQSTQGVLSLF
jgi:flagellin